MSTNGHDARGRFAPGNAGGPGRPARATEADYLEALKQACPPERFRELLEGFLAKPAGSPSAALRVLALVAKYVLPAAAGAADEDDETVSGA